MLWVRLPNGEGERGQKLEKFDQIHLLMIIFDLYGNDPIILWNLSILESEALHATL